MTAKNSTSGLMASGRGIFGRIADEGWVFVAIAGGVTIVLSLIYLPLGTFALGITLWFAHIMRMPQRQHPDNDHAIIAPADGVVVDIADARYPSASLPQDDLSANANIGLRLTIRTSLADMQWQCNPVSGRGQLISELASSAPAGEYGSATRKGDQRPRYKWVPQLP